MKPFLTVVMSLAILAGATACNKQQSAAQTQEDVNKAAMEANKDVTDAQRDASKKMDKANEKVDATAMDADHTRAETNEEVAVTIAKGTHKVAMQKCEALAGDAQSACKKKADADLEMAKAEANQKRVATDPKT